MPEYGKYIWDIFIKISNAVSRTQQGIYTLIPPTEYAAWFKLTDTLVYSREYDILVAMDRLYCDEANKELEDKISRERAEQQKTANRSQGKRSR